MRILKRKSRRDLFVKEALPHQDALYRMATRLARSSNLAQDLVQETYAEGWKSFAGYRPGTDCKAWLFRILFRVSSRHTQSVQKLRLVDIDEVSEEQLSVDADVELQLANGSILKVLDSIPKHYRVVLVLADVESFSYRQISDVLELPLGTVMSRLNRARRLLRERLRARATLSGSA